MSKTKEQQELSAEIMRHRDLYYNDEPEITDPEFDALIACLEKIDPNDEAITMVGAKLRPSEWKKVKHNIPMGSLNKVNEPGEMKSWIEKSFAKNDAITWSEKLDGCSIELIYDENNKLIHAITRGAGEGDGEDILSNVVHMRGVKKTLPFTGSLRGEIMLHRDAYEEHFNDSANPRNAGTGISRRLDGEGSEHLTVYFYQVIPSNGDVEFTTEYEQLTFLKDLGLNVPNFGTCEGTLDGKFDFVHKVWERYQAKDRDALNYEIDGLVVSVDSIATQEELGEHNHRSAGKMAWKFPNQMVETTIKSIEWTCKKAGRISPTVIIEPTQILGSTVERASVYNYDRIVKLGLGSGATVNVAKCGEIIPAIFSVIKAPKDVFPIPTECPACGGKVIRHKVYIECASDTCSGKQLGILNSWIKNLGVMEWGTSLLSKLVEAELVSDISDLYLLTADDLLTLERMGERSAEKAISELWKVDTVGLHTFIGSLGIPNVGRTTIEIAMDNGLDTLTKLFSATENQFAGMKGIGAVKAKALYEGLRDNAELINRIVENGIKVKKIDKPVVITNGKLSGMRICITGKTEIKRDDWRLRIEAAGGVFDKSVSKSTTHLVMAKDDSESTKARKAREAGVSLIAESDLEQMVS